jgi:hypothetical protein
MAPRKKVTVSSSEGSKRALTAAERREQNLKRIAGQQSQLKAEAAERRDKRASEDSREGGPAS